MSGYFGQYTRGCQCPACSDESTPEPSADFGIDPAMQAEARAEVARVAEFAEAERELLDALDRLAVAWMNTIRCNPTLAQSIIALLDTDARYREAKRNP